MKTTFTAIEASMLFTALEGALANVFLHEEPIMEPVGTRGQLIQQLVDADSNGCWTDEDCMAEWGECMTRAEAVDALRSMHEENSAVRRVYAHEFQLMDQQNLMVNGVFTVRTGFKHSVTRNYVFLDEARDGSHTLTVTRVANSPFNGGWFGPGTTNNPLTSDDVFVELAKLLREGMSGADFVQEACRLLGLAGHETDCDDPAPTWDDWISDVDRLLTDVGADVHNKHTWPTVQHWRDWYSRGDDPDDCVDAVIAEWARSEQLHRVAPLGGA